MAGDAAPETLEYTPTWVVAVVCTVIVFISLIVERSLHHLGKVKLTAMIVMISNYWFFLLKKKRQDALVRALDKLKEELMLLGFISLLLTVLQNLISNICIPRNLVHDMLPCKLESSSTEHETYHGMGMNFYYGRTWNKRRVLSSGASSNYCASKDKVPLLSLEALHQLHIFIFVLAVAHVVFSASTMVLGGAKINRWKHWEHAIQEEIRKQKNSTEQVYTSHHHDFVGERAGGNWRKLFAIRWMVSFLKQFHSSVTKSDYKALRAGFITKHCPLKKEFDFHKYMMRALEDDFKKVVGISWYLWIFVVVFLLLDIHGWHAYFWLSFLPLILLLGVGTKLEHIITKLALELEENLRDQLAEIEEEKFRRVKPSDHHFWFRKPGIVLYLIQFILFQNSFEMAFFFWIWSTYGFDSCIIESISYLIPRLVTGVIVQVLCSYSTLPLYAIVTQMGDSYKQAIFQEHLQQTMLGWISDIREKKKRSASALPSFLRFGQSKKKSKSEIQMQNMASRTTESSRDIVQPTSLENIVSLTIDSPESRAG